jgi:hypothetical protein
MEHEILRFWEEHGIFQKLREQNANGAQTAFEIRGLFERHSDFIRSQNEWL